MKVVICDDDKHFIDILNSYMQKLLEKHKKQWNILTCESGHELLKLCCNENIDAVFLDIDMPKIDGIKTTEKLISRDKNIKIVFVSNIEKYVYYTHEYQPFGFVPKSDLKVLDYIIDRMISRFDYEKILDGIAYINVENKKIGVDLKNAMYFIANGHYSKAIMKNGTTLGSFRHSLNDIERQLSKYWFVRIHKKYLVNCRYIRFLEHGNCKLIEEEINLPIGRSKVDDVKAVFQNYKRSIR